jgi:hypothetical protein
MLTHMCGAGCHSIPSFRGECGALPHRFRLTSRLAREIQISRSFLSDPFRGILDVSGIPAVTFAELNSCGTQLGSPM